MRWKHSEELEIPRDGRNAFKQCNKMMYPIIYEFLKILLYSSSQYSICRKEFFRTEKSWLRSNMGEERLSGLALMHIHKDIVLNEENVIEGFSRSGVRRDIEFVM
ncbi:hypothetical protein JTB14_002852 [Gonioctena quinquepunctata]|nr:hypothetical protein JTB14_002852 [Gonioctena quinquepunctata]